MNATHPAPAADTPTVLDIDDLNVRFANADGVVEAVSGLTLAVRAGETVGVVGESGCGKTQAFLAVMGLLARNGRATGSARFHGEDLLRLDRERLNAVRGAGIAMVFQDPMTSLNPYLRIATQMTEVLVEHRGLDRTAARDRAVSMLERVGIPDPAQRIDRYPHEFSGGMRQRAMLAMALLCEPDVLIADEPTTALDVTVQAAILELLADLSREMRTAVVLITHDFGVVARLCDRVCVMYAGRQVESGTVRALFGDARHPYSQGLLGSMPRLDEALATELVTIPGQPPDLQHLPAGCAYRDRCQHAFAPCATDRPHLLPVGPGHVAACHHAAPAGNIPGRPR